MGGSEALFTWELCVFRWPFGSDRAPLEDGDAVGSSFMRWLRFLAVETDETRDVDGASESSFFR